MGLHGGFGYRRSLVSRRQTVGLSVFELATGFRRVERGQAISSADDFVLRPEPELRVTA